MSDTTSASFCSVSYKSKGGQYIKIKQGKQIYQTEHYKYSHMLINVRDVDGSPHTILPISPSGSAPHPPPPLVEAIPSLISERQCQFAIVPPEPINGHTIAASTTLYSEILKA